MKKNPHILTACCVFFALLFSGRTVFAQTAPGIVIDMKDGKTVSASALRRAGDKVMATVQVGTGSGEVGYDVAAIARIEFPEPPQIRAASDFLLHGKATDALVQIGQVVLYYTPFKDIPGNWWAPAANLKLKALVALKNDDQAEMLVKEIADASTDPDVVLSARVQMAAGWARKGQNEKALVVFDEAIKQGGSDETRALAWLNKGLSLSATKEWDGALLAYLHVPVLYPEQKLLMPQALLGSARAYRQLDDKANAEKACNEIIRTFSTTPEAAAAKAELQKIQTDPAQKK
jgi:tetratricopeptide (TPR) repeat protein